MNERQHSSKVEIARKLRRSPTDAEHRLWQKLRSGQAGVRFRRQHPFGPFILDFFSPAAMLAVEVDGGQHYEEEGLIKDRRRIQYLTASGVTLLRFTNREVLLETDAVLAEIWRALEAHLPSP